MIKNNSYLFQTNKKNKKSSSWKHVQQSWTLKGRVVLHDNHINIRHVIKQQGQRISVQMKWQRALQPPKKIIFLFQTYKVLK